MGSRVHYNIGCDPFNEPKPNASGELVAPVRDYEDSLSPGQYAFFEIV